MALGTGFGDIGHALETLVYNSSFAPLISVALKTVRGKNNIFKAKSFSYILQWAASGLYNMIRRKRDITY